MSFAKFATWVFAAALSGGMGLLIVRYGFGAPDWGQDAVWSAVIAALFTKGTHESLVQSWSRDGKQGKGDGNGN